MQILETGLPGVLLIKPLVFRDERGFFLETFNAERYANYGIPSNEMRFVQDNHSRSTKGTLRGLHFQIKHPQGKLVSVVTGHVLDVVADVCPDSPTFKQWITIELSEENLQQLWIPPGYAHGFCVLSDTADFQYKCTNYYEPDDESGVLWNDPELNIDWPIETPLLSDKDCKWPTLGQAKRRQLPRLT